MTKTLNITVLAHDGPIAHAYLAILKLKGYRPHRIVHPVYEGGSQPGFLRFLPEAWRRETLKRNQWRANNYWPIALNRKFPEFVDKFSSAVARAVDIPADCLAAVRQPLAYEAYCDDVRVVYAASLNDDAIVAAVREAPAPIVLFTGGGLLRTPLLSLPEKRFVHVHPAPLPDIRGADGVLWSLLLQSSVAASVIFMSEGLDEGNIIDVVSQAVPEFPATEAMQFDDTALYRLIYSYWDPFVRAAALRRVVAGEGLEMATGTRQADGAGTTFHFMNARLKAIVFDKLFPARFS
jgi:folate-dependent phosphoribosylglycinamide formyltransferase PurN